MPYFADLPFTLIVPKVDVRFIEKARLKEFMLEHIVPGHLYYNYDDEDSNSYGNGNGHRVIFRKLDSTVNNTAGTIWLLNGFQILNRLQLNDQLVALTIDGYLGDRKSPYSKRNIQQSNNRYKVVSSQIYPDLIF